MVVAVIILLSLAAANGFNFYTSARRCLLFNKTCVLHCPRMMHPYHTRCDEDTMSQRTCTSPLTYTLGYTCGWSRCDCNGDFLLDEEAAVCVNRLNCPIDVGQRRRRFRKPKKAFRLSKKLRIRDYIDPLAV